MKMIPIAIAFTPNYFVPAATMLKSLMDASNDRFRVICLVTAEIPTSMQDKLLRLAAGRAEFAYIPLAGRLSGIYTDPRYTEAASFRLLLPEILPECDKILYLDCDVVVRQDMGRLYRETDLGNNYLAAVYEAPIEQQAARFEALGCKADEYFNSGFLIMNLELMRKEGVSSKLLEACKVDYLEFPDQDALNQVCKGRALPVSPVFNGIRTFFLPQYKADFVKEYSAALWDEVQVSGNIHYTGGKPWDILSVKFGEWWSVYDGLPREIKQAWRPKPGIYRISRLYRCRPVGAAIEWFRSLKRRYK